MIHKIRHLLALWQTITRMKKYFMFMVEFRKFMILFSKDNLIGMRA
jgi:hypothetical protein